MARPNIHDRLFRGIFCVPARAAELIRCSLPPAIARQVDWSSIESLHGEVVYETLLDRRLDLHFSARVGIKPLLFVLEHRSTTHKWMALRVLRYELGGWEQWLAKNRRAKRIPPMLSVVVSHDRKGWRAPTRLRDLIDVPVTLVGVQQPSSVLHVLDLWMCSDEEIGAWSMHPEGKLALLLLKWGRVAEDLRERLRGWSGLMFDVLAEPGGERAFELMVGYILRVSGKVTADDLMEDMAPALGKRAGEIVMTEAERLIALGEKRGEQRGEQRGELRGEQRTFARLFERRLGRSLTKDERKSLTQRLTTHGSDRVAELVLDSPSDQLADWLADPSEV